MIDRDSDLPPPFSVAACWWARTEVLSIIWMSVVRGADGGHQPVPHACLPPSHEPVVAGGARAIALGQVAPWRTKAQHPEDAVQRAAVIDARHSPGLVGRERFDHAPLEVGQVVSAHAYADQKQALEGSHTAADAGLVDSATACQNFNMRVTLLLSSGLLAACSTVHSDPALSPTWPAFAKCMEEEAAKQPGHAPDDAASARCNKEAANEQASPQRR